MNAFYEAKLLDRRRRAAWSSALWAFCALALLSWSGWLVWRGVDSVTIMLGGVGMIAAVVCAFLAICAAVDAWPDEGED